MHTKTAIMSLGTVWALAGATLLSLSLFLVPAWATPPPLKEVTVAYQPYASPSGALLEVIKRDRILQHALERNGMRLKVKLVHKGSDVTEGLRQKTVEVTTMGEMPLIETAVSVPVVVIGQHKQNFASVVTQRGTTAKELKGKRVGNAFATSGHYVLLKTLKNAGLDERDITLVQMDVTEMPNALLQGKIDAFAAWEPTPSSVIEQHPDKYSIVGRQESNAFLVVTRHFFDRYPAQVQALAAAVARSMAWLAKGNRQLDQAVVWNNETRKELAPKTEHPSHEALKNQYRTDLQMLNYSAKLSPRIQSSGGLLADELEFMKAIGKLPKDATWEAVRKSLAPAVMERVYRNPTASGLNRFDYDLK